MLKMFKIASRVELWALASVAFTMSACGVFWAGGVDEETNTVAAADPELESPRNDSSNVIQDSDVILDTVRTSDQLIDPPPNQHQYVIIHEPDPIYVETPEPTPIKDKGTDEICTQKFVGKLNNTNGESVDITVNISGESVTTQTNEAGYFELDELPLGTFPMLVSVGNSDGVAYLLTNGATPELLGPVPSSAIPLVDSSDFNEPQLQTFVYKDEPVAGNPGPHPEPDPEPYPGSSASNGSTDGNQSSSSRIEYMGHIDSLAAVPSNDLPHESDYGTIKHWTSVANGSTEEDSNKGFKWYAEWTIEATFKLNSIDQQGYYRKNIFGKYEEGTGVVSLAIINGECGTEAPSFALYVGRYGQFSCKDAVISTATVESGKTISLTGVFNGHYLTLYKDGFKIAEIYLDSVSQDFSTAPFVFGDKEIDMTLSDVRLGEKAITSADVLYRYYQRGGAQ